MHLQGPVLNLGAVVLLSYIMVTNAWEVDETRCPEGRRLLEGEGTNQTNTILFDINEELKIQQIENMEYDEGNFAELMQDDVESLVNQLDGKQAIELVKELPQQYREVVVMRYVDGLRPKEIAVLVEETENVVSVRIHRGIALLKTRMEELAANPSKK